MKTKKTFIANAMVAALNLCLFSALLPAETLTYREVDGDRRTTHRITITPAAPGYSVELTSRRDGGATVRQTFRIAAGLSTQAWTFSDPGRGMELAAALRGGEIVLSGSFQGKKVDERFDADGAPWNQLFQMGLGPFVLSGRKSMSFRSIGTQGPGELKIGKMSVTRQGEETIERSGRTVAAVHVRISLSGLLSVFWHGDYWYRKSDGRFLRYRGKNRSGGPVAVSELIEEKADAS
jgi:hypothetical protein